MRTVEHKCPHCGARTMLGAGGAWHCVGCGSGHEPEDADLASARVTCSLDGVEEWREYDFEGRERPYRIEAPRSVTFKPGGPTHRVLDSEGVFHLVPAPGHRGCVMRFKGRAGQ
jgi:hypothetical protein